MIRRIRKVLRLEAQTSPPTVGPAALSSDSAEKIPGIELNAGLRRRHLEGAAALRIDEPRRRLQPRAAAVNDPVVIVGPGFFQLHVVFVNTGADRRGLAKVEGRSLDGGQFACRNQGFVYGREPRRMNCQLVAQNVARIIGEIEVTVLR